MYVYTHAGSFCPWASYAMAHRLVALGRGACASLTVPLVMVRSPQRVRFALGLERLSGIDAHNSKSQPELHSSTAGALQLVLHLAMRAPMQRTALRRPHVRSLYHPSSAAARACRAAWRCTGRRRRCRTTGRASAPLTARRCRAICRGPAATRRSSSCAASAGAALPVPHCSQSSHLHSLHRPCCAP